MQGNGLTNGWPSSSASDIPMADQVDEPQQAVAEPVGPNQHAAASNVLRPPVSQKPGNNSSLKYTDYNRVTLSTALLPSWLLPIRPFQYFIRIYRTRSLIVVLPVIAARSRAPIR